MARNFHIADTVGHLSDPLKSNLWQVDVKMPLCLKDFGYSNSTEGENILTWHASSVSIPNRSVGSATTKFLGYSISHPLPEDSGSKTMDISFVDREKMEVNGMVTKWMNEIFDSGVTTSNSYIRYAGNSKMPFVSDEITIVLFGIDGNPLRYKAVVHNAFPTSISSMNLGYGNSSALETSVTFQFDYWTLYDSWMETS